MRIAFLTVDEPLYLPSFFERVLGARRDVAAVFLVPPLYRNQTSRSAAVRYARTFGLRATAALARRVLLARIARRSVSGVAAAHRVLCEHAADVNDPGFLSRLRQLDVDVVVSVSCPQLFRRPLIELPARGCLNVHGALLPDYRGVLPSFWMLANGEQVGGVSVFFVDDRIDGGELCGQRSFSIDRGESLDAFIRRSKAEAAELLLEVLDAVEAGRPERRPLDLDAGSYYSWPDRAAVRRLRAAGHPVW